jgi:hypothetical protein
MEFGFFDMSEPILQADAGREYPLHGIFEGFDRPPTTLSASLRVLNIEFSVFD